MNNFFDEKIIEKFIEDELYFELLNSDSEIKLINFLVMLFEKINIKPIIETTLNYDKKSIDLHIEFPNGKVIEFYMD